MSRKVLYCSFCGKSQHELKKLIASTTDVCICDECVSVCVDVLSRKDPGELEYLSWVVVPHD